MTEITSERANQFLKMFQYLATRSYSLLYEDNAYQKRHGIDYMTYPCSYQHFVLKDKKNRTIAELKQARGVFYFMENN